MGKDSLIGGVIGGTITGTAAAYEGSDVSFTFLTTLAGGLLGTIYPISLPFVALVGVNYMAGYSIRKYVLKDNRDERV